ncbi:diguanylate cyclase [Shewanella sp. SNU WT4]|uniref:sensor domain-containing diguanylate cyclase n=1 Tax=Shewanella sp. SNU WT4 TaxID=2590015 RepID=UPI00112CC10A|nr:GGDEF domain-containing protein [Shewanella sp. SNU WT4]QDF65992.1 diguanylate cyclase [Shewanella sp. SNU WT4]
MHRLLKRQLHKLYPDGLPDDPKLASLVELVEQAYEDFTEDLLITERSLDLSSNELNTKNQNLNSLLNAMPDTYVWLDSKDRVLELRVGQSLQGVFSLHEKNQSLASTIVTDDISNLLQHLAGVRDKTQPNIYEFSLHTQGDDIHLEARFAHLSQGQVLIIFRDITIRKQLDNYLANALEESKRTLQQLQDVINSAPIGFAITTLDNQVLMLNDYALEKFKLDKNKPLPQDFSQLITSNYQEHYHQCLRTFQNNDGQPSSINRIDIEMGSTTARRFLAEIAFCNLVIEGKAIIIQTFLDISERKNLEQQLRCLAQTDSLTGCFNRGHFTVAASHSLAQCQAKTQTFSLLALDLDKFKQINDTYGHAGGDAVLKAFCKITAQQLREHDMFGRFGGEEFIIALANTNHQQAHLIAERIRQQFNELVIQHEQYQIQASVSIGLISSEGDDAHLEALIKQADEYLYLAKNNGRNRVYG